MRPSLCWSCLASILKLLNFLHTFVGVSIILYSSWILNHLIRNNIDFGFSFDFDKLPAPWFVCALMVFGILVCLIAFSGHVAVEAISSCCLCFYAILTMMLILLEAVLVGDLVLNKRWEEDLPYDSTGELQRLRTFIEDNIDMSEWIGVTVVVIQVVSILLAMILQTMIPRRKLDCDSDEDFIVIRRPLLNPQSDPTYASTTVDGKGHHIWSSRMRQKLSFSFPRGNWEHSGTKFPRRGIQVSLGFSYGKSADENLEDASFLIIFSSSRNFGLIERIFTGYFFLPILWLAWYDGKFMRNDCAME